MQRERIGSKDGPKMKKVTLYSSSGPARKRAEPSAAKTPTPAGPAQAAKATGSEQAGREAAAPATAATPKGWRRWWKRYERPLLVSAGGLFVVVLVAVHAVLAPGM